MQVLKKDKKLRVTEFDSVKFQLITELTFVRKEQVIHTDIDLLAILAIWGPSNLSEFCWNAANALYPNAEPEKLLLRAQNIRNKITKLTRRGFVEKTSDTRKGVRLSPSLEVVTGRNILLNFNLLTLESPQTQAHS
jgi:hypothetical protein